LSNRSIASLLSEERSFVALNGPFRRVEPCLLAGLKRTQSGFQLGYADATAPLACAVRAGHAREVGKPALRQMAPSAEAIR
jgi:hypothetical protein